MFDVRWRPEINGVELGSGFHEKEKITPPRPVFYQELDLLGFDQYWVYPKISTPILWASGRSYYYKGVRVATAVGGNLYDKPELKIEHQNQDGSRNKIEPVDYPQLKKINYNNIKQLEHEASEFVDHTYLKFHNKADAFAVAYSGGKDSQVILDIVSKTLAIDQYTVIFGDTTMELPCTYEAVKQTEAMYKKRFPSFQIHHAKPRKDAVEFWKLFAPPSTTHRWCCTVCKTSPFAEKLFELIPKHDKGKVIVFEGVRASESSKRSAYQRISQNKKYPFQMNAEIILNWNNTEVYLYILFNDLYLNEGYRWGFLRVGCSMCPYGSEWFEFIARKQFPREMNKFIDVIQDSLDVCKIDATNMSEYIKNGGWKVRSGGRGDKQYVLFEVISSKPLTIIVEDIQRAINSLQMVGLMTLLSDKSGEREYIIDVNNERIEFKIIPYEKAYKLTFHGLNEHSKCISLIKKALTKSQFCVDCGLCYVTCPTLVFKISKNGIFCTHCHKCFEIDGLGCIRANSLYVTIKDEKMKNIATSRYQNFGFRSEMLDFYFKNHTDWIMKFNLGGKPMRDSMVCWLKDAALIDSSRMNTDMSQIMAGYYDKNTSTVWEVVTVNLYYGSPLFKWFIEGVSPNVCYKTEDLINELRTHDNAPLSTTKNSISSLLGLLKNGYLDKSIKLVEIGKDRVGSVTKLWNVSHVSYGGFLYALYKFCEFNEKFELSINDLFDDTKSGSPSEIFAIDRNRTKKMLMDLDGNSNGIVSVQFVKNLENIFIDQVTLKKLIDCTFSSYES